MRKGKLPKSVFRIKKVLRIGAGAYDSEQSLTKSIFKSAYFRQSAVEAHGKLKWGNVGLWSWIYNNVGDSKQAYGSVGRSKLSEDCKYLRIKECQITSTLTLGWESALIFSTLSFHLKLIRKDVDEIFKFMFIFPQVLCKFELGGFTLFYIFFVFVYSG